MVIRTVRWQKVKLDPLPLGRCQTHFDLPCGMDAVVVQNHMDCFRSTIMLDECPQEIDEQQRVLLITFHPDQFTGS